MIPLPMLYVLKKLNKHKHREVSFQERKNTHIEVPGKDLNNFIPSSNVTTP